MKQAKQVKLLQLIPAFWASVVDIAVTVIHQAPEYWQGSLSAANEGNPIGNMMMKSHVSGIFVVSGLWLILIGLLGYYLPKRWSKVFLLFTVIAHSYGASTWVSPRYGFWWAMAFMAFNAVLYIFMNEEKKRNTTLQSIENGEAITTAATQQVKVQA